MKAIVINAGPKRKDINAQLAQSAADGAKSAGADVEYIDLYKLNLSGCRVCLICKNDEEICKCYWRDELSSVIEKILSSDCLLIAAPIFFSQPTSHFMALLERLIYCIVSYKSGNKFKGKVNVGLFYTINYSMDYFEKSVRPHIKQSEDLFKMLNGEVVIETFSNISKNVSSNSSDEELKAKQKQFNNDLNTVFEIGSKLSK
ncbi:MAG: flavodoxin family protein [Methanobrevibacter sp.]|uniref:flavodoxin family protein n=1 Tax=Methanobrevibacter sp. TaxID=66852 RepID=UPI0025EECFA3|nr:flavodoxin family protein [Methanobrevibacter sp.]MBQ8017064.1 flavodoxin family protein [Methanobrevibacter sp.]